VHYYYYFFFVLLLFASFVSQFLFSNRKKIKKTWPKNPKSHPPHSDKIATWSVWFRDKRFAPMSWGFQWCAHTIRIIKERVWTQAVAAVCLKRRILRGQFAIRDAPARAICCGGCKRAMPQGCGQGLVSWSGPSCRLRVCGCIRTYTRRQRSSPPPRRRIKWPLHPRSLSCLFVPCGH